MASIEICPFCGKELKVGFFSGEGEYISIGPKLTSVYLCKDCCEQHKPNLARIKNRFNTKCDNYRKARNIKKLSAKELIDLYNIYIEQEAVQSEKSMDKVLDSRLNYFLLGEDGFFSVREFGKGFLNEDIGVRDRLKSADKSINTECLAFDKDDITKIEYAKIGSGSFNGFFRQVFSYAIRLNDESVFTYKPCITRAVTYGGGFLFGYQKSAEKRLVGILNEFKKEIGSDLPIVKVKKI